MALINCSECGKQVSDKATSCPNCGNPIAKKSFKKETFKKESDEKILRCPKCNSSNLSTNKKGFSGGKALTGAVLTGGIGLLAGTIGSNKVIITCLKCGYKFKAGEYEEKRREFERRRNSIKKEKAVYNKKIEKIAKGKLSLSTFLTPYIFLNFIFLISIILLFIYDNDVLGYAFILFFIITISKTISVINDVNKKKSQNEKNN